MKGLGGIPGSRSQKDDVLGGGYIVSGVGTICSGGGFLGGCLDILDCMVVYRWIEFGGRVGCVCVVRFGIKRRSVDGVECISVGK